jgi:hypothetical protein
MVEELERRAEAICVAMYGASHPQTIERLSHLVAICLADGKRLRDAVVYLRRLVNGRIGAQGEVNELLPDMELLAQLLAATGQGDEASHWHAESARLRKEMADDP